MTKPPRHRRLLSAAITLVACGAALEFGAWVAFFFLDGQLFSFARLARERAEASVAPPLPESFRRLAPQRSGPYVEAIHPYLGYVLDLEASDARPNSEVPTLRVEACGVGGPRRDPGTLQVGLFGGSAAFGFSEDGAALLARTLEQSGRYAGRKVHFVVAAAPGWKQPQPLMALTWLLALGVEFDVVVNLDGFDEVECARPEPSKRSAFPSYPRRWAERVGGVTDPASRYILGRICIADSNRNEWAKVMGAGAARWSVAANLLWRLRDRGLKRDLDAAERELAGRSLIAPPYLMGGPPFDESDPTRTLDERVAIWQRNSRLMDEICRSHSIRYCHLLQPLPGVASHSKLAAAGRELASKGELFVDLAPLFAVDGRPVVDDAGRLDRRGNDRVATRIAELLDRDAGSP